MIQTMFRTLRPPELKVLKHARVKHAYLKNDGSVVQLVTLIPTSFLKFRGCMTFVDAQVAVSNL